MKCAKCGKDGGELAMTVYDVCESCWAAMDTKEKRQYAFKATVSVKRQESILKDQMESLKEFWQNQVKEEFNEDTGKLVVLPDSGNGVRFFTRKGSPSSKKLAELGVSKETIDASCGVSKGFELF